MRKDDNSYPFGDRLIMVSLALVVFLVSLFKINDFDIWFHIKAGQYYWNNWGLPHTDPFLFAIPEGVRDVSEWFSELLMFFVWSAGGSAALQMVNSLVLIATFLMLYQIIRIRGCEKWLAFLLTLLAVFVARPRWMPRPYQMVNLGIVVLFWLVERWKREGKSLPPAWAFLTLFMIWSNLHPGAYLGVVLLALFWFDSRLRPKKMPLSIPVAAFLGSLLNADLFGQIQKVLTCMNRGDVLRTVNEHMPPDMDLIVGWFGVFVVIALATIPRMIWKKRWLDTLLVAASVFFSFRSRRYLDLFAILAAPPIAQCLSEDLRRIPWKIPNRLKQKAIGLVVLTVVVGGVLSLSADTSYEFGLGVDWEQLPVKAVAKAKEWGLSGNCYCIYPWGGYLSYCGYPEWKVFIDGRCLMYGSDRMNMYFETQRARGWENVFDKYHLNFAIIDFLDSGGGYRGARGPNIVDALFDSPDYALIYWDGLSLIFVRRGRAFDQIIEENELSVVNPNRPLMAEDEKTLALVEEELKRLVADNPENVTALGLLGNIYTRRDDLVTAEKFFRKAVAVGNVSGGTYANLGACLLYQRQFEEGVQFLELAVKSGVEDPSLCQHIAEIHRRLGNNWKSAKWQRRADKLRRH